MHKNDILTVLCFSKYASAFFVQRKPSGEVRILVHFGKSNNFIADDYIKHNHRISTFSDATQDFSGKHRFCTLLCSQAYQRLQMTKQRSREILAFNLASRRFAYKGLTNFLSQYLLSSFIRKYSYPVTKADQCVQHMSDIGLSAITSDVKAVNKCIRKA